MEGEEPLPQIMVDGKAEGEVKGLILINYAIEIETVHSTVNSTVVIYCKSRM